MTYINLNGKILAKHDAGTAIDNRAFRYGYGLFETMLYRDGRIELVRYHADRLFAGMKQLRFAIPVLMTEAWLREEVSRTVRKNNLEKLCRVRLQVFGGSGGMLDTTDPKPEYVIECYPLDEATLALNENGLVAGIAQGLYKSADTLANIKSCSALVYVAAAQQAKENKWNDALIRNNAGNIIESTIANIFIVKDEKMFTPPLSEGCVAGVMRRYLIENLKNNGTGIIETTLDTALLAEADEVFLTNAIRRIKWIKSIDDHTYKNDLTRHLYTLLYR